MKKSLFAVAALTAIAGAAQAQSSVTVYGILDVGYAGSNNMIGIVPASNAGTVTVAKTQTAAIAGSSEQTSRLGFKGTEDLGGGTSAFFTIEMGIQPMYGNLSGSSSTTDSQQNNTNGAGSAIDNRQTFVGLKKNGIGQFALGRQYSPIFNAGAATSPGQYNNVQGDVIYVGSTNGAFGQTQNSAFTNRADSALTFQTDSFFGARLAGMYALQNSNTTVPSSGIGSVSSTVGGGNTNWNGWGLSADYTWNKLYLVAAQQQFSEKSDNGVYTAASLLNLNGANPMSGQAIAAGNPLIAPTNLKDKQTFVGGTYDFGILKAYAQFVTRTIIQNSTTPYTAASIAAGADNAGAPILKRTSQQIGVRSFITPTIESWASVGNGRYQGANATTSNTVAAIGTPGPQTRFTAYQLGANYYLSKRTNLYGIFGAYTSAGQGQGNTTNGGLAAGASNSNQYAVGMRHTF